MVGIETNYAGVRIRYLAILIDLVVLASVFFPATRIAKGTWIMSADDHQWAYGWFITDPLCLTFLVVMIIYFVLFEGLLGATPGKRALRLRVISADGGSPGVTRAVVRNALRVVDSLPAVGILAAILIASSHEKTRFGDRIAGTRVIHFRPDST